MKKHGIIDQISFDKLLAWLDPDRGMAGIKYEEIRVRLIKIFARRGSTSPEELADETINRVIGKIDAVAETHKGEPALFFYGVAQKVFLESLKQKSAPLPDNIPAPVQEDNKYQDCLEICIEQLPPESRKLILEYYSEDKRAKIDHRKNLADHLYMTSHSLRMRAHRIKAKLKDCIQKCIKEGEES